MTNLADIGRVKVDIRHPNYWSATLNSSSAQTDEELIAAPGVGKHLVVTDIAVSSLSAQTTKLLGASTDIHEIMYTGGTVGNFISNLITGIALATNVALNVTSTAGTAHSITVSGHTEVD